jgi:hypothetical protein
MKTTFTLEEFRELFIAAMFSKPIIETTQVFLLI